MRFTLFLAACVVGLTNPLRTDADLAEYADPTRPVLRLGRDFATLQWFTRQPTETRVQIRPGSVPCNTPTSGGEPPDAWKRPGVRIVHGPPGQRTYHIVTVGGLEPGTRYSYRVYDPSVEPTGAEKNWGAEPPWRREFSFSTFAPKGRKTIVRIPIKVLLMPNVVNVASAHDANGPPAPLPPPMTRAELDRIRQEYAESARFLFINNGMRVWFDYQIFIDARLQRWGEEPANVSPTYRNLPVCRSYAGTDFAPPGGGDFTIVDTRDLTRVTKSPVYGEREVYVGQIEQAFPRRWNPTKKVWEFYNSGGGTYGADDWHRGFPGRSQYLGGGDTAWLATHEFHHQLESLGALSFGNNENDRVIFDHFFPRRRVKKEDGSYDEWTWSTSWRHGEHWDGIAYFDRLLTPVQWLRLHFGETIAVADADEDGVPDNDPRLPFDEKRFGSDPRKARTDGAMNDLAKAQLSTWAPAPLTTTWNRAPIPRVRPNPRKADSDGDGLNDADDPAPLAPWPPFIWPMTAQANGQAEEWREIPLSGRIEAHGVAIEFRQAHDDAAYYACFRLRGPWARVSVALDGEGQGYYTTDSTYAFDILPASSGGPPTVRPTSGNRCPGMAWMAGMSAEGEAIVEVSIPNRGDGLWFWTGGGREVGAAISAWTQDGRPLSVYEPYRFFYARMLERSGKAQLPPGAPAELLPGPDVLSVDFAQGPDARWKFVESNWAFRDGALRFVKGDDGENYIYLENFDAAEFDVWVEFEAKSDMHIGAWSPQAKRTDNMTDYVAFLGGFGNARSVIRLFGAEAAAEETGLAPGRHTMQLTRRNRQLWLFYDGKPLAWAPDPRPDRRVNRIGFLGGWGGEQVIYRARIRAK